jgi:hypothetical protein
MEGRTMPDYEQLSLLPVLKNEKDIELKKKENKDISRVSEKILDGFSASSIPFIGCDFDSIYPILARIIPGEQISFTNFPLNTAVVCEMVCAAICHQINWDFLRKSVYQKVTVSSKWLSPAYLSEISETEVYEMLAGYSKTERIYKEDRTMILRKLGMWINNFESVRQIFWDEEGNLLPKEDVRHNLLLCEVFSNDPEEKKMQLLLQKLSSYPELTGLAEYCQPAIDYHLVRIYLRRGLLLARNNYAKDFLNNVRSNRKESTMAAIRQICSSLLRDICEYSNLSISIVNQIEWHIGRAVCVHDNPDCFLESPESKWVKQCFTVCPFYNTCLARENTDLLHLNEPKYRGDSY